MDPGRRVSNRAGVGAGGLSPNKSLAGSFIFFSGVDWRRARAPTGAVLVSRL